VGISLDAQNSRLVVEHKAGAAADNRRLLISHLDG
jgi:glucokinase